MERVRFIPSKHGLPGVPNIKGVWYFTSINECVLCGAGDTMRIRRLPPKPEDFTDRGEYNQFVCNHHLM